MSGYRGPVRLLDPSRREAGSAAALLWRDPVRGGGWTWAGLLRLDAATAARLGLARGQPIRLCVPSGGEATAIVADDPLGPEYEVEITGDGPPPLR